ncbi:MAG: hypothetical protein ACM31H_06175 [Nitrososphaerales archaeon]
MYLPSIIDVQRVQDVSYKILNGEKHRLKRQEGATVTYLHLLLDEIYEGCPGNYYYLTYAVSNAKIIKNEFVELLERVGLYDLIELVDIDTIRLSNGQIFIFSSISIPTIFKGVRANKIFLDCDYISISSVMFSELSRMKYFGTDII